jgi:hypothetical protein
VPGFAAAITQFSAGAAYIARAARGGQATAPLGVVGKQRRVGPGRFHLGEQAGVKFGLPVL